MDPIPASEVASAADSAVVNAVTPQKSSEPNACLLMTSQVIVTKKACGKSVAGHRSHDFSDFKSYHERTSATQFSTCNHLAGAQGVHLGPSNSIVNFNVYSSHSSYLIISLSATVVNKVTCDLPLQGASNVCSCHT